MTKILPRIRRLSAALGSSFHRTPSGSRLRKIEPCYWVVDRLSSDSVILDMGLGNDADFSMAMIDAYGLRSFGFDPTRKHRDPLQHIADDSHGRFTFESVAVGPEPGTLTFRESKQNVSGSFRTDHINIKNDDVETYDVDVITLEDSIRRSGKERVDLIKMDIEGPECAIIEAADPAVLRRASQWCVEFHHDIIDEMTFARTRRNVEIFEARDSKVSRATTSTFCSTKTNRRATRDFGAACQRCDSARVGGARDDERSSFVFEVRHR